MAKRINILVVEPGKAPRPARVKNTLQTFSEIVGGPVEVGCYLPQRVMMVYREDGKNLGLPPNRVNPRARDYIAGTSCCAVSRMTALSPSRLPSSLNFRSILRSPENLCCSVRKPCVRLLMHSRQRCKSYGQT